MNIFVLDENPAIAAQLHCDKHVVKMIVEEVQVLSTCVNIVTLNSVVGTYKTTHLNHPCTIWARKSKQNFEWLCELTEALFQEYTKRYNKIHKSYTVFQICKQYAHLFPSGGLTPFAVAIADDKKCRQLAGFDSFSVVEKYRAFYKHDKTFAVWKNTQTPSFMLD